jgi:acyl-CoA reductase-like NAD-dependent aldehyde dehydrogenase
MLSWLWMQHKAFATWSRSSATYRSNILLKIADVMEANLEYLAAVETIDNGKPVRETMAADIPLAIDHFRYFAGIFVQMRAQCLNWMLIQFQCTFMSQLG